MKYYVIEPEVAGGFGENAVLDDPTARPPRIKNFHYEFSGWLGDPILETVGCFIVTEALRERIEALEPTGMTFGRVEVSKSGEFEDLYPSRVLPNFVWLQITGAPGVDDFGLSSSHRLVVSQRILEILREGGMRHCDFADFQPQQ